MPKSAFVTSLLAVSLLSSSALASGPVERLMQLLVHPSQPDTLVIRYGAGAGSHGFLFSRDGGKTFQLLCSANVAHGTEAELTVQRVSTRAIPSTAATVLDHTGSVMYTQYGASWSDDGTGCNWGDVPALDEKWALALKVDPQDGTRLWAAVATSPVAGTMEAGSFELHQRDAAKVWTSKGAIRMPEAATAVTDATLAVFANASTRRIYASMFVQGAQGVSAGYVLSSDDDGATWEEHTLPKEQERINLLAVDPANKDLVLAAISRDGSADTLLLSRDGGATFESYTELRAVGGIAFDATGRIFVGDIGDASNLDAVGGLYTAARTGEPLTRIGESAGIDCVQQVGDKLYVCAGDEFGTIDPNTGVITPQIRITDVEEFISCPGKDLHMICQDQLNSGPSWCCAGHYPFTPLCGEYDVTTRPNGGRVFCGLSGREYDNPGAGDAGADAGVLDASVGSDDAQVRDARVDAARADASVKPQSSSDGGCNVGATGASGWLLALALGLRRRKR
ncbi:MAG: hypothetical protein ABW352_15360 [Polyangiales bacterium]